MLRFDCATEYDWGGNEGYMQSADDGSYVQYSEVRDLLPEAASGIAIELDARGLLAPDKDSADVLPLVLKVLREVFDT
jgi:hypothetical protein